jgi:hypothetical protein
MKTSIRILLPTAILALAACSPLVYGKAEVQSLQVTQSNIAVPGWTGGAITIPANLFSFPFDIGEVMIDQFSENSSLKLNGSTVTIAAGSAATFQGIDQFVLSLTPPGGTATAVAKYDKTNKIGTISADGKVLTLVPTADLELIKFLNNTTLTIGMSGSGTVPNAAWSGAVMLDFHVVAQKNVV